MRFSRHTERGSALVYILIAIALLAALTFTFMEPSSQQTSSQNTFKTLSELEGQANIIRSAIQECVLVYPKGDKCINDTNGGAYCDAAAVAGTDPGASTNYPIDPDSAFYTNATPGQSGGQDVRDIRCPGNNPGAVATHMNHALIFSGTSEKFLPPPPDLFEEWKYYNGNDGVFFWTETSKTDAFLLTALTKLDENFSECEADVIDARSAVKDLDSDGTYTCTSGSICFRVRMRTLGPAEWNGDTDTDESGC